MDNKLILRKVTSIICAALVVVVALVSPFLNVVSISEKFGGVTETAKISGIDLYFGEFFVVNIWMCCFAVAVIFAVVSLFSTDIDVKEKRLEIAIAVLLFGSFLYLCAGIQAVEAELEDINGQFNVYTMTWLSLVLTCLILIGYSISKIMSNKKERSVNPYAKFNLGTIKNQEEDKVEPTVVETLVKYKELVDNGVITEEEYASIKEKILNG